MITKRGALAAAVASTLMLSALTTSALAGDGSYPPSTNHIDSRAEALAALDEAQQRLDEVEKYLRSDPSHTPTTEPSSPTTETTEPTTTESQPPPPSSGDTAAARFNWQLIPEGSDEFNYSGAPDKAKWGTYNGRGHAGNGRRVSGNNEVAGGVLVQTGKSNGDSAGMAARFGQKYGKWEVRARSYGTGTYHPVLILWPDNNKYPEGAEYDYLENSAPGQQCAEAYLHYPNHQPKRQEHAKKCNVDLTQWHNFGIEWAPNLLVGYLDGQEWFRFTGHVANAPGPMHQTIQLDNFKGTNMQPAKFEVDWARVYR